MDFVSLNFIGFFAAIFALYWFAVPHRWRVPILIAASLTFYAWDQINYLALLISVCLVNAVASFSLIRCADRRLALGWLIAAAAFNLLVLAAFKYMRLIAPSLPTETVLWLAAFPLPLGISFFVFHGISLAVDTYRGDVPFKAQRFGAHLKDTLLYVTFFPQLISGPITKAKNFIPQISEPKRLSDVDWEFAGRSLVVGYFFKMVVANNLNSEVSTVLSPHFIIFYNPLNLIVALFGYSAQIFADFAGYSSIALGLAALFGYRLPINFNYPYISQTFSEFWTRWHISLSTWLRDYLYVPLGGNRRGRARTYLNLMIVMGLGGLWHGASWNYAVWGLVHGSALAIERVFRGTAFYRSTSLVIKFVRALLVFTVVSFAWVLFKITEFDHAAAFFQQMFSPSALPINQGVLFNTILYSSPVLIYHLASALPVRLYPIFRPLALGLYGVLLAMIILNGGDSSSFIYFQF